MQRRILLSVLFSFLLATPAICDTIVGGILNTDAHWTSAGSPYVATQSLLVTNDATLTIDPGVEVRFDPLGSLAITSGQLLARGSTLDPVTFTTNITGQLSDEDRWGFISFGDDSLDASFADAGNYVEGSILENCIIEYAGGTASPGAINVRNASPYISHSTVRNNAQGGIHCEYADDIRIEANTIHDNTYGSAVSFRTSAGLSLKWSHRALLSGNAIHDNTSQYGISGAVGGIHISNSDNVEIANNTVEDNTTYQGPAGIQVRTSRYVVVSGNFIRGNLTEDNGGQGNDNYGGGGLALFRAHDAMVMENDISHNTANYRNTGGVALRSPRAVASLSFPTPLLKTTLEKTATVRVCI